MNKLTPALMVEDVNKTTEYYKNVLGFQFIMGLPEKSQEVLTEITKDKQLIFALMKRGNVEFMFQEKKSLGEDVPPLKGKEIGGSFTLYIETEGVKEFYEEIKNKVVIVKDLHTAWYGMREFYIKDCNGYILTFAEKA